MGWPSVALKNASSSMTTTRARRPRTRVSRDQAPYTPARPPSTRVSRMDENGRGVPQGDSEATRWYRLAADHGHAGAQFNLGRMYLTCRSTRCERCPRRGSVYKGRGA